MKLLFDQNLSPAIAEVVAGSFPDSVHVREVGLRDAADSIIWDYAKLHSLVIVSKDADFQERSLRHGAPPKFIWLRLGNYSVLESVELLRVHSATIHTFEMATEESHLLLP